MNLRSIALCVRFLPRMAYHKIMCGKRFRCGSLVRTSPGSSIRIEKRARLSLGDRVAIRNNTEIHSLGSIVIGNSVFINRNCMIVAMDSIEIRDGVTIGPNTCIYDHNHNSDLISRVSSPVIIEENAWIGSNVVILPGVHIGKNAVVAAGSVVTKDVPANHVLIQRRIDEYKN